MQQTVIVFAHDSILQVHCNHYFTSMEANKWAVMPEADEVWLVPTYGLRRLIRAFRFNPFFLKRAIRNMDGAIRKK